MAGFSELIKNFDKIRDYVRDFYIYGCKVRSDFDRRSTRTYDDEKRRVESWLGDCIRYDDSVRGRSVSISVDSGHIPENPLYNAYYSKSFTDNDIKLHFLIIDVLADGSRRNIREITDIINGEYAQLFDEQLVRSKLKEYADEGIVIAEKQGKTMYYALSGDRTEDYINGYAGLEDALKFFSETQDFGIIGNSILRSADLKNDLFFIKHNYMIHTLEDVLIPEILDAMDSRAYLALGTFSAGKAAGKEKEPPVIIPMQILVSVQTGRRYLAAYIPGARRFSAFRLDFIKRVDKGAVCDDYERIKEQYERNIVKCFGVSFGMRRETGAVTPIKITFYADEEKEPYIIGRLEREKRCAVLEKTGEHLCTITADVHDPYEIMHWAKTFIGRIVSVEGGCDTVRDLFYNDIARMKEMYGGSDEHIQ